MKNSYIAALCENIERVNKKIIREFEKEIDVPHGFEHRLYHNLVDLTNHSNTLVQQIKYEVE